MVVWPRKGERFLARLVAEDKLLVDLVAPECADGIGVVVEVTQQGVKDIRRRDVSGCAYATDSRARPSWTRSHLPKVKISWPWFIILLIGRVLIEDDKVLKFEFALLFIFVGE